MLYRFTLDLAIPEDIFNSIPDDKKIKFRDAVRKLKSYAVKINEGSDNEEMTVEAMWHKCYHDEGTSCGLKQEI